MYCVLCGDALQAETQAGIVCRLCKQKQEERRRKNEQVIRICYCFRCGEPYRPDDTSIHHSSCSLAETPTCFFVCLAR
jgi:hypothetical protein